MFGLIYFGPKEDTFIDVYCQQVLVAESFKRPSFLAHIFQKNSKLRMFSAYLVCITKVNNKWEKFGLERVKL